MRKLLFLLLMLNPVALWAQTGFYIKPGIGMGLGRMTNHIYKNKSTPAYKGEIAVGWQLKHIRLETGLSYIHTGFMIKNYSMLDMYPRSLVGDTVHFSSKNLMVPINIGYTLHAGDRVRFFPSVGLCVSGLLNTSTKSFSKIDHKQTISTANAYVNKMALWTTASFQTEIKISETNAISLGPTLLYNLTTFIAHSPIRLYNIQFDMGVVHRF